jgi:microcystin-dependent protein
MAEIGDKSFTTDMITLIKQAVIKELGTNAFVNRYLAEVTAVNTTTSEVSVKLSGSDTASDSFRARGIHLPDVGQQVIACIDGQDRWIESVIRPTTSTPYVTFATAAAVPTGAVVAWITGTAPTGWLLCDGSTYAYNTYPALGALRGASAGGNFTVPDMRDRFIGGLSTFGAFSNTSGGIGPNSTITNNRDHTHTTNITHGHDDTFAVTEHTSHNHAVDVPSHDHGIDNYTAGADSTVGAAGTSTFLYSGATGTYRVHGHAAGNLNPTATNIASFNSDLNSTGTSDTQHTVTGAVTNLTNPTNVTSSAVTYGGSDISPKSTLLTFIIKT